MKKLHALAIAAAAFAAPAAFAQTYYVERITVYEHPRYEAFVAREKGALQSGGATLEDTLLADNVAMAIAREPKLKDVTATVSAKNGRISLSGLGDNQQNYHAQQVAKAVAGPGNVSGTLSSDLG